MAFPNWEVKICKGHTLLPNPVCKKVIKQLITNHYVWFKCYIITNWRSPKSKNTKRSQRGTFYSYNSSFMRYDKCLDSVIPNQGIKMTDKIHMYMPFGQVLTNPLQNKAAVKCCKLYILFYRNQIETKTSLSFKLLLWLICKSNTAWRDKTLSSHSNNVNYWCLIRCDERTGLLRINSYLIDEIPYLKAQNAL